MHENITDIARAYQRPKNTDARAKKKNRQNFKTPKTVDDEDAREET